MFFAHVRASLLFVRKVRQQITCANLHLTVIGTHQKFIPVVTSKRAPLESVSLFSCQFFYRSEESLRVTSYRYLNHLNQTCFRLTMLKVSHATLPIS